MSIEKWDVIVVGAGLSGLVCAQALHQSGLQVCVLEKARGTGGRLSSKRLTVGESNISYDLGASLVQSSHDTFEDWLLQLEKEGALLPHLHNGQSAWVAPSRNSMLTRHLSRDLTVHFGQKVSGIKYENGVWTVSTQPQSNRPQPQPAVDDVSFAQAPHIIFSAPAEQTLALLPEHHSGRAWLNDVNSDPVFVSTFAVKWQDDGLIARVKNTSSPAIGAISMEHEKPQRDHQGFQLIKLQTSPEWSQAHIDEPFDVIEAKLKSVLESHLGQPLNEVASHTHRWLFGQYAQPIQNTKGYLSFNDGLHICGDYFDLSELGLERAFLSGRKLAQYLLTNELDDRALIEGVLEKSQVYS